VDSTGNRQRQDLSQHSDLGMGSPPVHRFSKSRAGRPCHEMQDGRAIQRLRYSVVLPVFNEGQNIAAYCRSARSSLPPNYELLVCYDFEEDDTLPALAAIDDGEKPQTIRLIRNTLGRGVRYAIEAGIKAADAPVVVVMMADLSDDFANVEAMVRGIEAGADVACASRYMRGGKQIGGPWLKGLMSRTAGLTLHWLSGLPTHDPTNSFKAYSREFLRRTPILSTAGFSLGLELTVRAHFGGGRVEEIPATWIGRSAGKSRFRLFAWLPIYLRWYFWAIRQNWLTLTARASGKARLLPSRILPKNHGSAGASPSRLGQPCRPPSSMREAR
jgi:dolichol-phosphate mannosyltransferase